MTAFGTRLRLPRAPRATVLMPASVVTMQAYQFPELVNISQTGAKLRGSPTPSMGVTALFRAGPFESLCRVVWEKGEEFAVRFEEPVPSKTLKEFELHGATQAVLAETSEKERIADEPKE